MSISNYDVLVVGAGPAGLATALAAIRHGASVLVVERHAGTSIHPRATGISTRTMEIFRNWGIAAEVRAAGLDLPPVMSITRTLADPVQVPIPVGYAGHGEGAAHQEGQVSPAQTAVSPQDRIEPLLVDRIRALGGEVRFDTSLRGVSVGPDGVLAELAERGGRTRTRTVHARYVVGADGWRSTVRRSLGIGLEQLGTLGEYVQMLFRAPLDDVVGANRYVLYSIEHPDAAGVLLPAGDGRWAFARQWNPERGESPDISASAWVELIRTATGAPDLHPELLSVLPFTMSAAVADTFRAGRAFLVGDAAHRMTPAGGMGLNTAIHDGHNLGWKLAWHARGWAGEALLDSYDQERQPVGRRNALASLHPGAADPAGGLAADLGVTYRSPVIAEDGAAASATFSPSGRPGERAPHRWVELHGRRMSTLDLFDGRLTLVTGRRGAAWRRAADACTDAPLAGLTIGRELTDQDDEVARSVGIGDSGAVLVRPDGYVAWRCRTAAARPAAALDEAIAVAVGRAARIAALAG